AAPDAAEIDLPEDARDRPGGGRQPPLLEGPGARDVPEPRLLRPQRVRAGGRLPGLLQQGAEPADAGPGGVPGGADPGTQLLRPADPLRAGSSTPAVRPPRDGHDRRADSSRRAAGRTG